ncbi:homocysteine S-methyltransferase family protein [Agrococcus carbonis]|uniref:Homocysteine/selenocysteine methylase (S-methylmethionine-dependent) n=1 Tax=Agrococcus carbonis TaxID=684552 RepID=A0A1H1MN55_9MICO|nr:homocysteine S-methyltransferase family protein [Agrococcus carbonis]SDR88147.1 Homocysteine/selenocysteine methylase (S-methylmethionine-dependent) [Agrococcus carbonis]
MSLETMTREAEHGWPTPTHPYVTDGGLETDLVFNHRVDLPHFAAYPLLRTERGRALLATYFAAYAAIARRFGAGLLLETPTWRANPDWGSRLGDSRRDLYDANVHAVRHLQEQRDAYGLDDVLISGAVGPRGDAYAGHGPMDPGTSQVYHEQQVDAFAEAGADLVTAFTLSDPGEAIGIARAAYFHGLPVIIGFTVETDGRMLDGSTLHQAIAAVDREAHVLHYMINCAHPEHVRGALEEGGPWRERIASVRYNASTKSHAELDAAEQLDAGDIDRLRDGHEALRPLLPGLAIVGGCCGTDARHVAALWEGTAA